MSAFRGSPVRVDITAHIDPREADLRKHMVGERIKRVTLADGKLTITTEKGFELKVVDPGGEFGRTQ